jgi:hypothetical protein
MGGIDSILRCYKFGSVLFSDKEGVGMVQWRMSVASPCLLQNKLSNLGSGRSLVRLLNKDRNEDFSPFKLFAIRSPQ